MGIPFFPRTHFKIYPIAKQILAFMVGFFFHFFMDTTPNLPSFECPSLYQETTTKAISGSDQYILGSDGRVQMREPFKPQTRHEVIRFQYFNTSNIYDNFDSKPLAGLSGHYKADVKDILSHAMASLNSGVDRKWEMKRLVNGYRRFDPLRGEEYVLDVETYRHLGQNKNEKTLLNKVTELTRVHLVKPFNTIQTISRTTITKDKMIHFIIPISSKVGYSLDSFLDNFEKVCLQTKSHCFLMVIIFAGTKDIDYDNAQKLRSKIERLRVSYKGAQIKIIETKKPFSRSVGLDIGLKQLADEALVFFCDTDIGFSSDFLARCRLNADIHRQVYYPIVFAQYNPRIVEEYSPPSEVKHFKDINSYTGHWVHYGFGMVCMHAIDYRAVGGFGAKMSGLGTEDLDLFEKHVKSNLRVFRAMDPGLIHYYHEKSCSPREPASLQKSCQGSLLEGYGSKAQLAAKILLSADSL